MHRKPYDNMLAIFRFYALCLLKGLIKHWNQGINFPLSFVCCLPCMWGQHPIYTATYINGILPCCCMLTLIENTDIMQNMYITVPHICFMTYTWACKQKWGPGETDWNPQACSLVWPWPLSRADIFQSVIEMASQIISMVYNTVATVCRCMHVSLKAWHAAANHLGVPSFLFILRITKLLTHMVSPDAWNLTLYWSKSPGISCLCCILLKKEKK